MRPTLYIPRFIQPKREQIDWPAYDKEMGDLRQMRIGNGLHAVVARINLDIQSAEVRANVCKDDDVYDSLVRRISTLYFEGRELLGE